jgi:benzoate-CoA ligase
MYVCSDDGYYTYWGRADDMLRVGGEWVAPAQVEAVLIENPEVLEAAVVGVRDDNGIQRPVAHVIPAPGGSPTPESLTEWCRERLAGYKVPKRVVLVDRVERSPNGKTDYRWAKSVAEAAVND